MSGPVLWQGAKEWAHVVIGEGHRAKRGPRCSSVGCLATLYAQYLRDSCKDKLATPETVVVAGLDHHERVWFGAQPVQTALAAALGLVAGDVVRSVQGAQAVRNALLQAMSIKGGTAILHVDGDHDDGSDAGQHFVGVRRIEGDDVVIADPATAREERLDLRTLSGVVMWGTVAKRYEVRSVRPLCVR